MTRKTAPKAPAKNRRVWNDLELEAVEDISSLLPDIDRRMKAAMNKR
jgi:hypothetical protein